MASTCEIKAETENLKTNNTKMKIAELANSVDPDAVAHNELPHLELHGCLPVFKSQDDITCIEVSLKFCRMLILSFAF